MTNIDNLMEIKFQYGMRACGSMQKIISMNSLEGLQYWRKKGIKFFEVDVDSDGYGNYVACHNFVKKTFDSMEMESPSTPDRNWFLSEKMYSKTTIGYTTMDLNILLDELNGNDVWVMMIDPKFHTYDELIVFLNILKNKIASKNITPRRILIETYNKEMINAARNFLFPIIHCVDEEEQQGSSLAFRMLSVKEQIKFLKDKNIKIVSYPWKNAIQKINNFYEYKNAGFFIISKTRNDVFSDILIKAGVNINLVDYLLEKKERKGLEEYREEYLNDNKEAVELIMKKYEIRGIQNEKSNNGWCI